MLVRSSIAIAQDEAKNCTTKRKSQKIEAKKTVLSKPIEIEETKLCVHVKQTYTLAMIPN